jgi:hypothetical protein
MDMRPDGPFPDCDHLASWAAICPGNNESAGKRRSGKTRQGNRWLRGMLTQTGWAAAGKKNSLFLARYQQIKLRRGGHRAVIAIAHAQLIAIYWALRNGTPNPERVQQLQHKSGKSGTRAINSVPDFRVSLKGVHSKCSPFSKAILFSSISRG